MAYFLVQGSYTAEAWATLVKNPQDRSQVLRAAVEKVGGQLVGAWFALGDCDMVMIVQMPNTVTTAAVTFAAYAGGGTKAAKITPLMTMAEGLEALKQAATIEYSPPRR